MLESEQERFSGLLLACGEIYNRHLSDVSFELFWNILKPYGMAEISEAVARHMRTSSFMPTPHDLLKHILGGDSDERAVLSWPMAKWLLEEPMMEDCATLLPDGAAAMAANDCVKNMISKHEIKYNFEFFRLAYKRYFDMGLSHTPLVFEWPRHRRDGDDGPERPQTPVLFPDFWPLRLVKAHRAALESFKPGNSLVARLNAGLIEKKETI